MAPGASSTALAQNLALVTKYCQGMGSQLLHHRPQRPATEITVRGCKRSVIRVDLLFLSPLHLWELGLVVIIITQVMMTTAFLPREWHLTVRSLGWHSGLSLEAGLQSGPPRSRPGVRTVAGGLAWLSLPGFGGFPAVSEMCPSRATGTQSSPDPSLVSPAGPSGSTVPQLSPRLRPELPPWWQLAGQPFRSWSSVCGSALGLR